MSDTPRTDAEYERLHQIYQNAERINGPLCCSFENDMRLCRQLERELNAANERIKRFEFAAQKVAHDEAWAMEHRALVMTFKGEWKASCWHEAEQRSIFEKASTIAEAIRNLHNTCDLIDLCERPSHE